VTTPRLSLDAGQGLARIVLAVLEVLEELLERQAIRRMDAGTLSDEEIERLGQALIALRRQFAELRTVLVPDDPDDPAERILP
jgi:hypothetical protein